MRHRRSVEDVAQVIHSITVTAFAWDYRLLTRCHKLENQDKLSQDQLSQDQLAMRSTQLLMSKGTQSPAWYYFYAIYKIFEGQMGDLLKHPRAPLPTGLHGHTVMMHTCGRLQYWTISATASVAGEQPQPSRATSTWSVLRTSLMNASSALLRLHYKNALGSHGDNQLGFCCDFWLVCVLLTLCLFCLYDTSCIYKTTK